MANLVVTSSTLGIKVVFNAASPSVGMDEGAWPKDCLYIQRIGQKIRVIAHDEGEWFVSHDGANGTYQIDSVNGVAPNSVEDLFAKLYTAIYS